MILDKIVADKRVELATSKARIPLGDLKRQIQKVVAPRDFASALQREGLNIIAEVKKASPSGGVIRSDFDPVAICQIYAQNEAAAISVITESTHFLGLLSYLKVIKSTLGEKCPPLLRKDFIFDPYQVYESRAMGADSLLLIAAILSQHQLNELLSLSREMGMECLVEIHNKSELDMVLQCNARIIGINNRDLTTFNVDLTTTGHLKPLIPKDKIVVSESGIKTREDMIYLKKLGINAALIGEAFMSTPNISSKFKELSCR